MKEINSELVYSKRDRGAVKIEQGKL